MTTTGKGALALIVNERLAVPAHFDAEVYSAFRRHFRRGLLQRPRLDVIAARLAVLAAERVGLPALLPEAHALADRVSAADAFYLALARIRGIELLTADERLARTAAHLARVRLVSAA